MASVQYSHTAAFAGLLGDQFVVNSIPPKSEINPDIELIKGRAGLLALTIFDAGKKDLRFSPNATFSSIFSQEVYGAGFTKGLSTILAYLICLDEDVAARSEAVTIFASKVQNTAQTILKRISGGDSQLSDVRQIAEKLDNEGGYYQITSLDEAILGQVAPANLLKCPLEIDPYSGHLVAKIDPEMSQKLIDAYTPEIKKHLTEDGQSKLGLPNNIGIIVVAYKDELANLPQETVASLLQQNQSVDVSLKTPYIVPVRGDNRYSMVASVLLDSPDIAKIRNDAGLKELYSPGRPLRFTFGAVHNSYIDIDDEALIEKMSAIKVLNPWKHLIEKALK